MGEILSTIGRWIETRIEEVWCALKEAWIKVLSFFDGIMAVVRRVFDEFPCFSFTRETEWMQSETTGAGGGTTKARVEVGLSKLKIGTERDNQPAVPLKLPSDMSEKQKEELGEDLKSVMVTVNDFVDVFLKPGQHDSRETEHQKLKEFMKKPHYQASQAALARRRFINPGLA